MVGRQEAPMATSSKWITPLVLSACVALLPGEARAQFSCSTPIRFHFVALSDAGGANGPTFGPNDVQPWITAANTIVGTAAGVQFQYRSNLDWEAVTSTPLNNQMCYGGESAAARAEADRIVAAHPGKIVVFLRRLCNGWNPSSSYAEPPDIGQPIAAGWGSGLNYIVTNNNFAPSATADLFVHELGHYLGLYHTFPGTSDAQFNSNTAVANWLSAGNNFNGDLIADTAEDPGAQIWGANGLDACTTSSITLSGNTYSPSRTNVMSYYLACTANENITPGQVAKIQATLSHASRRDLCQLPCYPDFHNVAVGDVDKCLGYWKHREGFGPHALTVDWSGTVAAGSLKPNSNGWIHKDDQADYENETQFASLFSVASHHYSYRETPTSTIALGATRPLSFGSGIETYHRLDGPGFSSMWQYQFQNGKALTDVSVTRSSPLEISAVWANRKGQTSATYFVNTEQDIRNRSDSFYGNRIRLDRVVPIASGWGHTYLANWNYSTALRGVFTSSNAGYQSLYNSLAGLAYRLHDIEYFENAGVVTVWEAPHNECTQGTLLHSGTDNCTQKVCNGDPWCCSVNWDGICVAEVTSWCGRTCPP
jgi:pregnancy-associated plasma protein-A